MDKLFVIYHGNCADGFGAAWAVRTAHPDAEFYAGFHQTEPPDVAGRDVVMVDFSYKRPVILDMAKKARSITIIDHHKSAQENLVDLPDNVEVHFDMERSGAVMAWRHVHTDKNPPTLLAYIQDRDLWRFSLPCSREVNAAVFSYPYDFDAWTELCRMPIDALIAEGTALLRKQNKDIAEMIKVAASRMGLAGHDVPVINVPYMWGSDAAHILCENEPFAAYYWDSDGYRNFGLRSREDGYDVSLIAARYGGGGHAHAAGFKIPIGADNLL